MLLPFSPPTSRGTGRCGAITAGTLGAALPAGLLPPATGHFGPSATSPLDSGASIGRRAPVDNLCDLLVNPVGFLLSLRLPLALLLLAYPCR